jgi:phosphate starvation-inducible PhoH-like protein
LGVLEVQPLAYIRGKSIDNTILLMEAQNMSPNQMKTLLTRIGDNSKFIISGDLDQSDRFRHYHQSGLYDATIKHILMRLVWLCLVMKILLEIK